MSVHTSERMGEKGGRGEDAFLKIQPICPVLAGFPGNHWEENAPPEVRDLGPERAGTSLCQGRGSPKSSLQLSIMSVRPG